MAGVAQAIVANKTEEALHAFSDDSVIFGVGQTSGRGKKGEMDDPRGKTDDVTNQVIPRVGIRHQVTR